MITWCSYPLWSDYQGQDKQHVHHLTVNSFLCVLWDYLRSTLSNFQVYNTILFTIVTMQSIRSLELITEGLYPLTCIHPFSSPPGPSPPPPSYSLFQWNRMFLFHISMVSYSVWLSVWFISLSVITPSRVIHTATEVRISVYLKRYTTLLSLCHSGSSISCAQHQRCCGVLIAKAAGNCGREVCWGSSALLS